MATIAINFLLLKIIQMFVGLLPNNDYEQLNGFLDVSSHVLNIFAWVNQFVPTQLILILLSLSASLFFIKMFWKIINKAVNIFK